VATATKLDRMLDRVDLDRSLLINEKIKSIWNDPVTKKITYAEIMKNLK
jgi:hypothetical protein